MEAEVKENAPQVKKFQLLEVAKGKELILPWSIQKECNPANTLNFVSVKSLWPFDLQSCKIINLHCFKFVVICYSATGNKYISTCSFFSTLLPSANTDLKKKET